MLASAGAEAVHTLDLPDGNRTKDNHILDLSDREHRVLVTKDADFVDSNTLHDRPAKLLLVSTGNLSNADLEALMFPLLPSIIEEFNVHVFLEIGRAGLIVRG